MEFLCFVIFSLICQVPERELRKRGNYRGEIRRVEGKYGIMKLWK